MKEDVLMFLFLSYGWVSRNGVQKSFHYIMLLGKTGASKLATE